MGPVCKDEIGAPSCVAATNLHDRGTEGVCKVWPELAQDFGRARRTGSRTELALQQLKEGQASVHRLNAATYCGRAAE